MRTLWESLSQLQAARERDAGQTYRERYSPDAMCIADLETRSPSGERYHWDGLRRGGDPERPFLLFKVTLDGCGCYESLSETREPQRIGAGKAFAAASSSAPAPIAARCDSQDRNIPPIRLTSPATDTMLKAHETTYVTAA